MAGDETGSVAVCDLAKASVKRITLATKTPIGSVAFTNDGKGCLVAATQRWIKLVDLAKCEQVWIAMVTPRHPTAIAPLGDAHAVVANDDGSVRFYSLADGHEVADERMNADHATALAAPPDGSFVLAATARGRVVRYDIK